MAQKTALQLAQNSNQGMKGGLSVVKQMSMLNSGGAAPAAAAAPVNAVSAAESEARESNQRKALKELMIKFETNQRQMAEAQRQLIEGQTSVFSGVSRTKMGLMLLGNNLMLMIIALLISMDIYSLHLSFDGTLNLGGEIRADGLRVVSSTDEGLAQSFPIGSLVGDSQLKIRPGVAGAGDASLVLMAGSDDVSTAFSMAVPRAEGAGFALSAGNLEAVAFDSDSVMLGKHSGVGNVVNVLELSLHEGQITSTQDLLVEPVPSMDLVLEPEGDGLVAITARDLKVTDNFQVGPRPTYVTLGGLEAYAGEVPTLGVNVEQRAVTIGSVVDPVAFEMYGDSTFKGNLTLEHGDLNLVDGQLTLKDMNFGKVRSLSFNKGQRLGDQSTHEVNFKGDMEMRDESNLLTFSMSARDGSIFARGEIRACTNCLNSGGNVELQGSVVLGGMHGDGGWANITGEETTMHSISALGDVQIGAVNASTSASVVGGIVARSHTPGLYSKGVDPLMAVDPVDRSIRFGANFEASGDAALHSRVLMRTGAALGNRNRLDVRGVSRVSGPVHVKEAELAVHGVTRLQSNLNGTAMLVEGGLVLGLNETVVEIPQNRTYYSLNVENASFEYIDMAFAAAQQMVSSQNMTFEEHVISRSEPLPPLRNVTRESQFHVAGVTGDLSSQGSVMITQNTACLGDVTLSTRLDRLSELFNETDNVTTYFDDPAAVTVNGAVRAHESVRIDGNVTTSTWCAEPPMRPNTTNITVHLLLGFSNNTNESFPMPPCNHSFSVDGSLSTNDLYVNVSRYRFDTYGHALFEEEWWDTNPNITTESDYQYTRLTGGFRVMRSTDLSAGGLATFYGSVRVIGANTPCFSNPCKNDATCHDVGNDDFICDCQPLWTGRRCEILQQACLPDENDCAPNARCAHTGPCETGPSWPGFTKTATNPCPQEGDTFTIPTTSWLHECVCPYGYHGTSTGRGYPLLSANNEHRCTLRIDHKYYMSLAPAGELQAIKVAANPSSNDAFVKDALQIRRTSQFENKVHFGRLNVIKELVNTTGDGTVDLATCVTEWDTRTLQRQLLCPGEGNPNGEGLISAHIFGFNVTYPGAGTPFDPILLPYYNPRFLSVVGATQTGSLTCEDTVQFQDGVTIAGGLDCLSNYMHSNGTLSVLDDISLGSYAQPAGTTITVRGNLLSKGTGHTNPFVVSPASGEVSIEGELVVMLNSTMSHEVTLGRSAYDHLTVLGNVKFNDALISNADVLVNASLTTSAGAQLVSDMRVLGTATFNVDQQGLTAHGHFLIQSNAITTFSVQTWAKKVYSGNFTIVQNVDCEGFISTGTLDASRLMIDTISGTKPGVGTTIGKTLIEGGGFRVIQVDELEEMYVGQPLPPCATGTCDGGIDVSGVILGEGQAFLAIPSVVDDNSTVMKTPEEMSVTLATLLNSGHMAVMDGSVTTLGFMQYYYDSQQRLEPMAQSVAINAGTETDWTEDPLTQNAFMTVRTTFEGDLSERWRIRSNGDMDFGTGLVVCLAETGDTTIRGDVAVHAEYTEKKFDVTSTEAATVLGIESLQKSTLRLKASGREFDMVVEDDTLHVRGSAGTEDLLQISDSTKGKSLYILGDGQFCDDNSLACDVAIKSQEESRIEITSHGTNDAKLEIKTGLNEAAGFTLQDDPAGTHSQMNLFLYGQAQYDAEPLLGLTDKEGNHLLDIYDTTRAQSSGNMRGEIEGDVQFGGPAASKEISLTVYSEFEDSAVRLTSGQYESATLSLVGGYGQSASLNFVNQRNDNMGDGLRELRIKTNADDTGYQTLDFVDGACWVESSVTAEDLAGSGLSQDQIDATVLSFSATVCEHTLMSIRPDELADDVSDVFVSGHAQFGSTDGSASIYQALLESSDANVGLTVTSAAEQVSMVISAGYLNSSVLHLREKTAANDGTFECDMQILHKARREVQRVAVSDGNTTTYEDGESQMFQSLVFRNDNDLLTVDVDTSVAGEISGNMKLDGQADFCDDNADSVCTVAVQSADEANLQVISFNSTADLYVSPGSGAVASLNLATTLLRAMRFANDVASASLHLQRTEDRSLAMSPTDPYYATLNTTHFLTLENVGGMGKLSVPGVVQFGQFNSSRQCRVEVASRLMATLDIDSASSEAAMKIESDTLCLIKLQSKANPALLGETSTYSIFSDDIMEEQPTLNFNSTMNSLLAVQPNSSTQQMLVYSAVNTTFQTGPPENRTDWEFRGVANMTDFNQTVHTVGHMHVTTNVVIGDASKPMDHNLEVRSMQDSTITIQSSLADADMIVHAGRDQAASIGFAVHGLLVGDKSGILTTPLRSTLSLKARSTTVLVDPLPTMSLTDEDLNDLFVLYDVERTGGFGSSGYASLSGDVTIGGFQDSADHRLTVQAMRQAKVGLAAGPGQMAKFEVRSGEDVNQFIIIDSVAYINAQAPPHTRALIHLKCGLGSESFNNVNGSVLTLSNGKQTTDGYSIFDIESDDSSSTDIADRRQLLRMHPKIAVSNGTSNTYVTHQLTLEGSAKFGTILHQSDKNVTIKAREIATMRVVTGASDDASMQVSSGPARSAVLSLANFKAGGRTLSFFTNEIVAYGTGVLTLKSDTTDLLTLTEISAAGEGGFRPGHVLGVPGTLTALTALSVSNDVKLGDSTANDVLFIGSKFTSSTLSFLPDPTATGRFFTLRFLDPSVPQVITFPDTSTRPSGGGRVLTRLSTQSTLTEVATLTQGSIVAGFGSIVTDETINTTCLVPSTRSSCGEIIASGNLTVQSLTSTQGTTYLGSALITTAIQPVGEFTDDVEVDAGNSLIIQSSINQKTTAISGHFDPMSGATPSGTRVITVPDVFRDLSCSCNGLCSPTEDCGPGSALVLYRAEVQADEVGSAYLDATTGVIESFITLMNPGDAVFINMNNNQLTTESIVVATISEFGSGGIVVVHAVTIMTMTDGSCVFSIKNIGQDSMVGHFKIAFVIF